MLLFYVELFYAKIHQPLGENVPFYLIESNAFLGKGGIAFRPYFYKMPPVKWLKVKEWLNNR